jgi:hypothetical protein
MVDAVWIRRRFRSERLAIVVKEGLKGQDPGTPFRQSRRRPIDSEGKLDMWDSNEVRTQLKHRCGRGETIAKPTTIAVARSYVIYCYAVWQSAEQKGRHGSTRKRDI